jgi:2-dehydropantoate 2-reductase
MKIGIYGTGGVGGYFGARLAQAGHEVYFVARGEHLNAIQRNGLQLISPKGDAHINPCNADETLPKEPMDLILLATKTWQLTEAAKNIKDRLGSNTLVISLLNGVRNETLLSNELPKEQVLGGLCRVVSKIEAPGVIRHISYEPTVVFGELDDRFTDRAIAVESLFKDAGIKTRLSDDIRADQWTKFMFITTISGLGALTGASVGQMLEQPDIRNRMKAVADEVEQVAIKLGISLPEDVKERQFEIIREQPYGTTSSLQRDMMEGRPSELEEQTGAVVILGKELGVPTPVNTSIYEVLKVREQKARQR